MQWTELGPPDDLFLTLSDVAPTILITPAGPGSLTLGLSYTTGSDRFVLTAGSATLTYDPASGGVSGPLATGFGKNARTAFPDPVDDPSQLAGMLIRPDGSGANGLLTGTITHSGRRDYTFAVEMTEKTIEVAAGPGCASAPPTDVTPAP